MSVNPLHAWTVDPEAAVKIQEGLRDQLNLEWDGRAVKTVGGVDISLKDDRARAAIVVLGFPELFPLEEATSEVPLVFPYIPGLLTFREGPAVLAAWEKLAQKPDLIMFDGQGIAHPRGIGIASQMGLWLDRPTIGVAKSRLYGRHDEVGLEPGEVAALYDQRQPEKMIGGVVRTKKNTKPLYISPGHLIDVQHAVDFVLRCVRGYRLPEPTRWAHNIAGGATLPSG
ncbi:MAG: deoxyribonuclease V [Chloroflexi bacterium]|nr:deoxyribonuclease V [Chloroflexota bacterium]